MKQPYHHGDLRRALLAAAVEALSESGPASVSLRDLARRTGVSHAAPNHHFGDKAGMLTAVAAEGFELLAGELERAGDDLLEVGLAYVRFAVGHRAHFEVMFQPGLYHAEAPEIRAARLRTRAALTAGLGTVPDGRGEQPEARLAAWSMVHGFASLWLAGALQIDPAEDAATAARPVLRMLFAPRRP